VVGSGLVCLLAGCGGESGLTSRKIAPLAPVIIWAAPAPIAYGTPLSASQLNAAASVPGVFTYTPATGTQLDAGSQTLSVTFTPTDTTDYTPASATVTIQVSPVTPTLAWATLAAIAYGTALGSGQLDASSGGVAGTFVYSPAAGTVLPVGPHSLTATFTPTDSTDFTTATASVAIQVNPVTPTLAWATPAALLYGTALGSAQLDASSGAVAGTFTYSPAAGTVLTAGAHSLTVTFTPTDSTDFTTATASVTIQVSPVTPTLAWVTPAAIVYGTALSSAQFDVSSGGLAGTFTYSPAAGTVLTAGSHSLTVTFTPTDSTDYTTATASVTIQVSQATPALTWATPAAIVYGTALNSSQLDASSGGVAGTFVYSPAAGTVLGAGPHSLTATFTPTDSTDYTTATASVTIQVSQATPALTWATPAAIVYGTALSSSQLNASSGSVAGTFAYSPAAGTVLAGGSHSLTVTFTPADSADYTRATASVTIQINPATPTLTWATPVAIVYRAALGSAQLDASSGGVAGWFAYSPAAGAVLAAGSQSLTVTFTPVNSANYTTATATVTLQVNQYTPTIKWATPETIVYGTALGATQLHASAGDVAGTLAYSPAAGAVLAVGSQSLTVTFTPTDPTDYTTATASVTILVNPATPKLTWATPAAILYGTALSSSQLHATSGGVAGTFAYSPAPGAVLAAGSESLTVTFTPTDSTDYTTAPASVTILVNPATPKLTWATPAAIVFGTALSATQLDASSGVAGTFTYSPAAGTVPSAGSQSLAVTFTPTDSTDYTTASATVKIQVKPAAPTLTWATPAALLYGTALGSAHLDASSGVAGTFTYSPAAGTVLAVGSHSLTVTFTPADSSDYSSATATVSIQVNRATPALSWATPTAIVYGTALGSPQLDASAAGVAGGFAYSPAAGTVLTAGSHCLMVTFTPADSADYSTASLTVKMQVSQATPTLTWAAPAEIVYGTALSGGQLDATASVAGTFVYSPNAGTVLTGGAHTLSATFIPSDKQDYAYATASVTLVVDRAVPAVQWNPAPPTVGLPLGPSQLNATAFTPGGAKALTGSFLYSPDAGTVFSSPGPELLSVTFMPADSVDYTAVETSVTTNVAMFGVAAWGDSLTQGNEGTVNQGAYPSDLSAMIVLPVENLGASGQTSTQIGVREGAIPTYVSVAGGTIPASGGVTVSFNSAYAPVTSGGPAAGVAGTILGVHGLVTFASGVYTFTRTAAGDPVSAPGTPQFVVDTPYASYISVFWEGRNNLYSTTEILNDIAAQVATVPPGQTYLVMSVINENIQAEWAGGATYGEIVALDNQLANLYGPHYLDIRHVLVESYDPTQVTDVSDYSHDEVPTSLRANSVSTTLAEAIGPADTTLTLNSTNCLNVHWILTIDTGANAENVEITAVSGSTVTVARNFGGLNTSHAAAAPVTQSDYLHLNGKGYQAVAQSVAQFLSAYAGNTQ